MSQSCTSLSCSKFLFCLLLLYARAAIEKYDGLLEQCEAGEDTVETSLRRLAAYIDIYDVLLAAAKEIAKQEEEEWEEEQVWEEDMCRLEEFRAPDSLRASMRRTLAKILNIQNDTPDLPITVKSTTTCSSSGSGSGSSGSGSNNVCIVSRQAPASDHPAVENYDSDSDSDGEQICEGDRDDSFAETRMLLNVEQALQFTNSIDSKFSRVHDRCQALTAMYPQLEDQLKALEASLDIHLETTDSSGLIISSPVFNRLMEQVARDFITSLRVTDGAFQILHHVFERFAVDHFRRCGRLAQHAGRDEVTVADSRYVSRGGGEAETT
jgi:histone H3/H4